MKLRYMTLFAALFVGLQTFAQEGMRIFLIGDSTCATKDLKKENPERGWGHVLPTLFDGQVEVFNHAVNGRSTKSFRAEGRWQRVVDELREGDYVFIQFGHNDQKINDSTRYSTPEAYAENLRRYVREAREKGARPILLTPIVRRNFVDGKLEPTHGDYPEAVRRISHEEGVVLLDMTPITRHWVAELGDEASKEYYMWLAEGTSPRHPDGRNDDTHLNGRGARAVARMILNELRTSVPELGRHVVDHDIVVAKDGSGDFFTIAEAVAAIPDFCRDTTTVLICEGLYREKTAIPATKRNVLLEGRGEVVISWDDYSAKRGATGHQTGTSGSSTIYFGGDNWRVENITFENTAGRVGQAVAVQCLGNNITFAHCRFLGNQDTLYLYGLGNRDGERVSANPAYKFVECYIEGTTDFIFGAAAALFEGCEIHSKADSYITAASTCEGAAEGFVFRKCRLTAAEGVTSCYLGRPWRIYAQTIFIDCRMGGHIRAEGWHDWSKPEAHRTVRYAEYGSTGEGAGGERVKWARRLSKREIDRYRTVESL